MDWFVLLTPLLLLAVVALLGFAGCDLAFPLDPIPPKELVFRVHVPTQLTVLQAQFQWLQPGGTLQEHDDAPERVDEDPQTVAFLHRIAEPKVGSWSVDCRLQVRDPGGQVDAQSATGVFILDTDSPETSEARFETKGRPANNDFQVVFIGLVAAE